MSRKIVIWIALLLVTSVNSFAQLEPIPSDSFNFKPLLSVKLVPSAFLNFTIPSAQAGVEYRAYKNLYVGHEFGYMVNEQPYLWRRGLRHMTEARLYLDDFSSKDNHFFGLQFRYWWFRAVDEGNFCRQNCLFTQTMQYQIEQSGAGTAITYGRKRYFINDKIFMEPAISIGRILRKNETDLPNDVDLNGFSEVFFNLFGRNDRWTDYQKNVVTMHFHLRLGIDIR